MDLPVYMGYPVMANIRVSLRPTVLNTVEAKMALKVKTPYNTPLLISAIAVELGRPPPAPRV
jgi:hypothetical protein